VTSREKACGAVVSAAQGILGALEDWNAVDLEAIGKCLGSLESSAGQLDNAVKILRESPAEDLSSLHSFALQLKSAALQLERLVDSSAAFLRHAPGLACDEPGTYQVGGSFRASPTVGDEMELRA
jgi:hypothetical protein